MQEVLQIQQGVLMIPGMLRSVAVAALLLVPLACSGDDDTDGAADILTTTTADPTGSTTTDADDGGPVVDDPCEVLTAAVTAVGWTVSETEIVDGPGGPRSQCTWDGTDDTTSFRNGWVMFIPTSQIDLEYHEDEEIDGVGTDAFRGSPQTGEILVTGADVPFRIWVTGGSDNDTDAATLAAATITATP
jgi:hypothetical protein